MKNEKSLVGKARWKDLDMFGGKIEDYKDVGIW